MQPLPYGRGSYEFAIVTSRDREGAVLGKVQKAKMKKDKSQSAPFDLLSFGKLYPDVAPFARYVFSLPKAS